MASSKNLTPEQRSTRARLAAYSMHAQGKTNTKAAQDALQQRFLDEVDPDRVLPEAERLKRAEYARKLYYTRLAYKAARARAAKRQAQQGGGEAA
ncbi:hypothetical protein [Saccharomonospora iraqiensis]|uniref:hypothetical protein n=1 Tax=Saccharomonospora iraqiensis TaxID=52698 RepID=UPI00047ABC88|nr:hypothetical protein [Saccharomonospora iraqiensis]